MFFTAEPINADKALAWGLIDEIGPDPVASALAATDLV
jgi:enoyl-CoA hydratase/carnithine racemase